MYLLATYMSYERQP